MGRHGARTRVERNGARHDQDGAGASRTSSEETLPSRHPPRGSEAARADHEQVEIAVRLALQHANGVPDLEQTPDAPHARRWPLRARSRSRSACRRSITVRSRSDGLPELPLIGSRAWMMRTLAPAASASAAARCRAVHDSGPSSKPTAIVRMDACPGRRSRVGRRPPNRAIRTGAERRRCRRRRARALRGDSSRRRLRPRPRPHIGHAAVTRS
jgi:hypothetical protein